MPGCHDVGRFLDFVRLIEVNSYELDVNGIMPSFAVLASANNVATIRGEQGLCNSGAFLFRKTTVVVPNQARKRESNERRSEGLAPLKNEGLVGSFPSL